MPGGSQLTGRCEGGGARGGARGGMEGGREEGVLFGEGGGGRKVNPVFQGGCMRQYLCGILAFAWRLPARREVWNARWVGGGTGHGDSWGNLSNSLYGLN